VSLRARWYELLEDFSSRFLSYESDKLPALSGLASTFTESFGRSRYLAGIWTSHMSSALLWKTTLGSEPSPHSAFQPRRAMLYRGPTWSWVSVDSFISYESQRLTRGDSSRPEESIGSYGYGVFEIIDSELQLASRDQFGAISAASLQLKGCILPLQFFLRPMRKPLYIRRWDEDTNRREWQYCWCIISRHNHRSLRFEMGLLLEHQRRILMGRESAATRVVSKELHCRG
jgi:hypothetical protein